MKDQTFSEAPAGRAGRYITQPTAFIPAALPPDPALRLVGGTEQGVNKRGLGA